MPNQKKSTRERVKDVALTLLLKGISPTGANIRESLGNTGSMTTINDALQAFWTKDLPGMLQSWMHMPGVPEDVSAHFIAVWDLAIQQATVAAETVKTHALNEVAAIQQQQAEQQAFIASIEQQLVQLRRGSEEKDTALGALREQLAVVDAVKVQLESELTHLRDETKITIQHAGERVEQARQQVGIEAKRTEEVETRLVAQLEQAKMVHGKQEKALNEKNRLLNKQITTTEKRITELSGQLAQWTNLQKEQVVTLTALEQEQKRNQSQDKRIATLEKKLATAQSALDQYKGQNKILSAQVKQKRTTKTIKRKRSGS